MNAIENMNVKYSYLYFLVRLSKHQERTKKEDLLNREDLDGLREICIKELESEFKASGTLINRHDLKIILDFWFEYSKEANLEIAKNFALSLLESKDTLIKLLNDHIDDVSIDRISSKTIIDRDKLSEYFDDITVVDKAVAGLDENKLDQMEIGIINLYKSSLNYNLENNKNDVISKPESHERPKKLLLNNRNATIVDG